MKNIAVILAGGAGKRFDSPMPKQFLVMADGLTMLEHGIQAMADNPHIVGIVVVMHPNYINYAREIINHNPCLSACSIDFIPGGTERWESSWNAIQYVSAQYGTNDTAVLIHDAARPYVSQRILNDVCEALQKSPAVTVAVPSVDTVYQLTLSPSDQLLIDSIPDRQTIYRAQTPQAFHLSVIENAYHQMMLHPFQVTDDVMVLRRIMPDIPILIVLGEEQNKKITFPEDIR